jgi:hypothetical protein
MTRTLQVLVVAIFASAMFFFSLAVSRAGCDDAVAPPAREDASGLGKMFAYLDTIRTFLVAMGYDEAHATPAQKADIKAKLEALLASIKAPHEEETTDDDNVVDDDSDDCVGPRCGSWNLFARPKVFESGQVGQLDETYKTKNACEAAGKEFVAKRPLGRDWFYTCTSSPAD